MLIKINCSEVYTDTIYHRGHNSWERHVQSKLSVFGLTICLCPYLGQQSFRENKVFNGLPCLHFCSGQYCYSWLGHGQQWYAELITLTRDYEAGVGGVSLAAQQEKQRSLTYHRVDRITISAGSHSLSGNYVLICLHFLWKSTILCGFPHSWCESWAHTISGKMEGHSPSVCLAMW